MPRFNTIQSSNTGRLLAFVAVAFVLTVARGDAAVFATYDAAQHNANGFAFGDFNDFFAVDTSEGVISIDIMNDVEPGNGLFGGMGSDLVADFNANTTQIEIALTVDALNAASGFNIVLVDNDGVNTGEEYQYNFDLSGVTPGVPIVLTKSATDWGFRQAAFEQTDGDMILNYGLRQVQIQSIFDGTDRLKIDVESVKLVDPDDPLLFEFNTSTYAAQAGNFTFGTFSEPGVLDATGATFVINADPAGTGGPNGGFGFSGLNLDFEASDYQIEIEAKLLPGNSAGQFNLLLGDNDGDDSGPGLGSEDYIFSVDTADFNSNDFATVTIPLGSGTESAIEQTFGFTNGGDGLQNFDLSQMQIQASGDDPGVLNVEILRFAIVERSQTSIAGDYDNSGAVGQGDLDLVLLNWGADSPPVPDGWVNEQPDGLIGQAQLDGVLLNWGNTAVTAVSTVPEPATAISFALGLAMLGCSTRGRRRAA